MIFYDQSELYLYSLFFLSFFSINFFTFISNALTFIRLRFSERFYFSSDLSNGAEMEIAKRLRREGIKLFAVNIQESEAPGEIVNLARTTGGEVFNPDDTQALANVFSQIDEMTKAELEQGTAELVDWFFPFCIAGLTVLGVFGLFLLGWRHTPW